MKKETLKQLEEVNQLTLTEEQRTEVFDFISAREKEFEAFDSIDVVDVEKMVHVMPINTVVREDVVKQPFTREQLQKQAPETEEGFWCVPKVLD